MNVRDFYSAETGFANDPAFCDWCLGQVIQALVDDGNEEAAALFLACEITWQSRKYLSISGMWDHIEHKPVISGPISIIKKLRPQPGQNSMGDDCLLDSEYLKSFDEVLRLVLGIEFGQPSYEFQIKAVQLPEDWREELLEIARKKGTTNQGRQFNDHERIQTYANLRFRSATEVKIAKSLDRVGVMYYANCTARLSRGGDRINREPDFLVCQNGRWGILEIDGKPFHPPSRKVDEDEKDRLFKHYGVTCIEHYDADRCFKEPQQVVAEFLDLLAKNG